MPPRIRTRASKALKENIDSENNFKRSKNNTKVPRKALADKTNSASDDTSVEVPRKEKVGVRPRRDRRLPSRFVKNQILVNSSISNTDTVSLKNNAVNSSKFTSTVKDTPGTNKQPEVSSFKTPSKVENSIIVSRPRRICRLPSRFDDHLISPNKYISIEPSNASTPKPLSKGKPLQLKHENSKKEIKGADQKLPSREPPARSAKTAALQHKLAKNTSIDKSSPDSNNNAKIRSTKTQSRPLSPKKISPKSKKCNSFNKTTSTLLTPNKDISLTSTNSKTIKNNLSFKVLGSKKRTQENIQNDCDIYEFTFDPNEEPQPQKKKRKKPATKKVAKPRPVLTYKSTYDQNISKALSALKNIVKPSKTAEHTNLPQLQEINDEIADTVENNIKANHNNTINKDNHNISMNDTGKTSVHQCNYPSIRVEDIAADIEPSIDHCDDINYSPVKSPRRLSPTGPNTELDARQSPERPNTNNDPLNLQEDISFFDDVPVASSSMNVSVKHPLASPWRVEFGSLPIKWQSNTYVKPNMTPAVESSFICSEDSNKRKHVYTNMVPEANEALPQIVSNTPSLKQTSIISFIKEVAEKQAKKKRGRSVSPSKATVIYDKIGTQMHDLEPQVLKSTNTEDPTSNNNTSEDSSSISNNKNVINEKRNTRKRKNNENICDKPAKSPHKQMDNDCTYFGFDDSENHDQENMSPNKIKGNYRTKSLRSKSRVALKEINGPTRALLPVAPKSKTAASSEAISKAYELKSATDVPVLHEKNAEDNVTVLEDPTFNDDFQSVHLFEDIEVVHHMKPTRKSYGKAKKVTFQNSASDNEPQENVDKHNETSFEDDLGDLTFEIPNLKEKKKTKRKPKKLMSKKEEKEAEEWAAGFNSMCEEIEDFPLVVE